jgi:uncharacterized protein
MRPDEALLEEIVKRILSVAKPDRIILFGSAATGTMTPDSDIDLLILDPEKGTWENSRGAIYGVLRDLKCPFDVILRTPERFDAFRDIIGGIEYPANKYGRVLYDSH